MKTDQNASVLRLSFLFFGTLSFSPSERLKDNESVRAPSVTRKEVEKERKKKKGNDRKRKVAKRMRWKRLKFTHSLHDVRPARIARRSLCLSQNPDGFFFLSPTSREKYAH